MLFLAISVTRYFVYLFAICVLKDINKVCIVNAYRYKDISFETSNNFRPDLKPIKAFVPEWNQEVQDG